MSYFDNLSLEDGIFACGSIIFGIICVLFGYRLFTITLFVSGTYVGYILSYSLLLGFGIEDVKILFFTSLAIGLLAGALLAYLWKIGLFAIGCFAGFTLSMFLLGFLTNTVVYEEPWKYIFTAAFALAGGVATFYIRKV